MQEHSFNPENIMKDVYSYPYPEVRQHIRNQTLDPEFMMNTLPVAKASSYLDGFMLEPPLSLPENTQGAVDLDEIHIPVIERIRHVQSEHLVGLEDDFEFSYPMPGSSQSMFTLMSEWKQAGKMESLAVVRGEYDGYRAYAESLGIPVSEYDHIHGHSKKNGEVWFVSNPSAIDGNWHDDDTWKEFVGEGHDIVLDAAYVGLTDKTKPLDVSAKNIQAILTSPSKLFGVFRYRNTGVTYTRDKVNSMYGSKWFKDVPALLSSLSLYETFGHNELPQMYRSRQEHICRQLGQIVGSEVVPSDVLLLANTRGPVRQGFERFRRAGVYRFGLSKLFEDMEQI